MYFTAIPQAKEQKLCSFFSGEQTETARVFSFSHTHSKSANLINFNRI